MTVFDDGSGPALYVGGSLVSAGGVLVNGIAKWDGTEWSALTGPSGTGLDFRSALALTVFDDGSGPALFVAGVFTTAGGVLSNHIAKWDGETWAALAGPSGVGVNNSIHALTVFDDGTGPALFAGGEFTIAGGIVVNRIAKWDGKSWSALSTSGGTGVSGDVLALSTYDDGGGVALYAGGRFVSAGGLLVNRIARWDGSDWSGLSGPSGVGVDGRVDALTVFGTGGEAALIVGGAIGSAGGVWVSEIAKWNGSEWSALADPSENDFNGPVAALMVFDDGDGAALYAGGGFTSIGGLPADGVARWTGEEWSALVGPTGFGVNESVVALAAFDDGSGATLFAGGIFTTMGGMPMNWITKWNGDSWSTIAERSGLGLDYSVLALGLFEIGEDSAIYVGGYLKSAGGIPLNGIAKWGEGGWSDLSGPAATGVTGPVWALSVFDDGGGSALFAAGSFQSAGGVLVNSVAKWNGTEWSALTGSSGTGVAGGSVNALTVFDDGSGAALYVGGSFTTAGGVQVNRIAKWDGTEWSALEGPSGTGVDGTVNALAVFDDGNGPALFVGGNFLRAGGVLTHRIAKWDGNQWTALAGPSGTGLTDEVRALTVLDGGDGPSLFAGGVFLFAGGVRVDRIARWDGSNWSALDGPEGTGVNGGGISSLSAVDDGTGPALYAGGSFTMAGGIPARHIARWSGDAWAPLEGFLGNGVDGDVRAIAGHEVAGGSVLFAGGSFSEAGGLASSRIASYSCLLDESAPVNPAVQSTSPPTGSWSNDSTVEVTFSGAVDGPSGSGVAGYSVLFDQNPTTAPDDAIDIQHTADPHVATSEPLSDGDGWFFHLSTCDFADNCSSAIHTGPFRIDTSSPSAPGLVTSPSHDGGSSNDSTIEVDWDAATDPLSGVAGYRYDFAEMPAPPSCVSLSSTTTETSATSGALADGTWYAHVCAFDSAGNFGEVTSGGPYEIDTTAAAVESVGSVPDSGDGVLVDGEVVLGGTTRLLVRWSDAMADPAGDSDPEDVTNPANYRLVGAGSDGSIGTGACAPVAGDDVEWPFTEAAYDATNEATALGLAGPLAIPADLYRISVCGTIEDDAGNPTAASSIDFRVLGSDLLVQPNFDDDLAGWTVDDPFPGSLLWSPDDAGGEGSSGSAEIVTANGTGMVWTLSQCVAVDAPRWLGRLRARIASSTPDQPEVTLQAEWFAEMDCAGAGLGTASAPPVTGDTGDAWLESVHDGGVPPGAASARIDVVVTGGTASTFTAAVDDLFHGNPFTIFIDGFETATTERWSATVPLAP